MVHFENASLAHAAMMRPRRLPIRAEIAIARREAYVAQFLKQSEKQTNCTTDGRGREAEPRFGEKTEFVS